jgi:predicted nuclease of predicted toxin-antitoxin system
MRFYLDEDIGSRHLAKALEKAGHDVLLPADVGRLGKSDIVQFAYAVETGRVFVTGNHRDFQDLNDLILLCGGSHPGVLTIRKDNDRRRDMKAPQIVAAVNNLCGIMQSIGNHLICLNEWR